jgi:hypothetical protein
MTISDDQLQQRAHEWLEALSLAFLDSRQEWESIAERRKQENDDINTQAHELLHKCEQSSSALESAIDFLEGAVENLKAVSELFHAIAKGNSEVQTANAEYCNVERTNFAAVEKELAEQVVVYKDIRSFFLTEYQSISAALQEKYNQ